MSLRDSYSKLKQRLKGKKRKPDGTGTSSGVDSTEQLPQPDPHVVEGSGRGQGKGGDNADGPHIHSTEQPVQRYGSEPLPAGKTTSDREGGAVQKETQNLLPRPDTESVVMESGRSGEVEQANFPPSASLPLESAKPDSTLIRLLKQLYLT